MDPGPSTRPRQDEQESVINDIVSSEPELGLNTPDGGYGWIVFIGTLFFHVVIPSLIVSFGIFVAIERLPNLTGSEYPYLWDDKLMYTPLLFIATWTFIDPASRLVITSSTWPRLVATSGTCLTCAGLLFLWMGKAGYGDALFYPLAGVVTGIGASVQMAQCEIILAQYFRLKHTILAYITQAVTAIGFIASPIIVGHHVLETSFLHVVLWYQAFILQGVFFALTFKKPAYLKSKPSTIYNYVLTNADEEEDILSKNSRELQIKRQDSTSNAVVTVTHEIPNRSQEDESEAAGSSGTQLFTKKWETFENEDEQIPHGYEKLNEHWEHFDDDTEEHIEKNKKKWVKFEDDDEKQKTQTKPERISNLFSDENETKNQINGTTKPMPLFSDTPVNNNITYSYDVLEQDINVRSQPAVFMPNSKSESIVSSLKLLGQPTFYKSFLTVLTTKFSIFIFYTLFPVYLYEELDGVKVREMSSLMGILSISNLLFSGVSYWINVDKKRRPICMWILCWLGSFGYFMISDSNTKQVLIFGAVQITLSLAALEYVGMPILGLTLRGETNKEFNVISIMVGCAFAFFLFINSSFKNCFRFMALLHFFTGAVWFSNYIYKKIMKL